MRVDSLKREEEKCQVCKGHYAMFSLWPDYATEPMFLCDDCLVDRFKSNPADMADMVLSMYRSLRRRDLVE